MKSIFISFFALILSLNAHAWSKSNSVDVLTVNQENYASFTFFGCDKSEFLTKYNSNVFVTISSPDFVLFFENTARTLDSQVLIENAVRSRKGVIAHLRDENGGTYPSIKAHYSTYKISERQAEKLAEMAVGGEYSITTGARIFKD